MGGLEVYERGSIGIRCSGWYWYGLGGLRLGLLRRSRSL